MKREPAVIVASATAAIIAIVAVFGVALNLDPKLIGAVNTAITATAGFVTRLFVSPAK